MSAPPSGSMMMQQRDRLDHKALQNRNCWGLGNQRKFPRAFNIMRRSMPEFNALTHSRTSSHFPNRIGAASPSRRLRKERSHRTVSTAEEKNQVKLVSSSPKQVELH